MYEQLIHDLMHGNIKALARCITLIENEAAVSEKLLQSIQINNQIPVIGITGPPGSGKSTLTDALIGEIIKEKKKVAVLCIDPSSPFHYGALLGDRIRMRDWYLHPNVYIRSLAARGALGGLHVQTIAITDILKAANFDLIIIETVGVGQNEIDIARLADITVVVLVPESGDDIQTMKNGLMEIANLFVMNKCDRPGAEKVIYFLQQNLHSVHKNIPVIKAIAIQKEGISEINENINSLLRSPSPSKQIDLLKEKAYQLLVAQKIRRIDKTRLSQELETALKQPGFNLYRFVKIFNKEK
jgi:GTPase